MIRRLLVPVLVPVLVLGLVACGFTAPPAAPEPQSGTRAAVSSDGWFAVSLPPGWRQAAVPPGLPGTFLARRADDRGTQLVGNSFGEADGAEEAAVWAAASLADGAGIYCERLEDDETFGDPRLLFDCPSDEPRPYHKVLVPVVDGDRSVLLLFQVDGVDLAETATTIRPLLESFTWR